MSWPGAPGWKIQFWSGRNQGGKGFGTRRGAKIWTRFFLSKMGSKSAYFIGIGSHCDAFWTWFWGISCWGAWFCGINRWGTCCRGRFMHTGWHSGWGLCWTSGGSFVAINADTKLVNFSTSARSVVTSPRSSETSCSSWSTFPVCTSVCICEPNLDKDITPLYCWIDLL